MKSIQLLSLILIVMACAPESTIDQSSLNEDEPEEITLPVFPDDYLGQWGGDLLIHTANGIADTVPMQLHLEPVDDSTYTYTIIYGEDVEAGTRPYLLKEIDRDEGRWYVDEQNTILLDGYYLGGVFYEPFSVQGTALTAMLEKRGDELIYGIIAGPQEAARVTGDQVFEGDTIPAVESYRLNVHQRAILRLIE